MGLPIVMGRKTFESIGRPLPGRANIVISRNANYKQEGCLVANDIETARKMACQNAEKIFVIGGSLDDLNMALNAGGVGVFFKHEKNSYLANQVKSLELANPGRVFSVDDLVSAAEIIKRISHLKLNISQS